MVALLRQQDGERLGRSSCEIAKRSLAGLRRVPKGAKSRTGQEQILDRISIRERPAEAEDRAIPGHWEGDLLAGTNDTNIVTLVERHSRFTMLVKLARRDSATVLAALADRIGRLPEDSRRSLTWDQGKEVARHRSFTIATDLQVYFCDSRSPWQRGSNENQRPAQAVLPRATNFSQVSQAQLDDIALRLNQRPRKTLDFETPDDRLHKVLR